MLKKISTTCEWNSLCTLKRKINPHLGGLNIDVDVYIATLYICQNEDLGVLYSSTLDIQNNIDLSKFIIYPIQYSDNLSEKADKHT